MKARQVGSSTFGLAWSATLAIKYPGIVIMWVAPDDTHRILREKWRTIINSLKVAPEAGYPGTETDNPHMFKFENGSRIMWVRAGGSEKKAAKAGVGDTAQLAFFSELAKWEFADATVDSLMPALEKAGASVVIDSTPPEIAGMGAKYLEMIRRAAITTSKRKEVFFWPWFWEPDYADRRDPLRYEELTEEEKLVKKTFDLDLAQMAWRRRMRGEYGSKFWQIYPETVEQAISSTGDGMWDGEWLAELVRRKTTKEFPDPLSKEAILAHMGPEVAQGPPPDLFFRPRWWADDHREGYVRIWDLPKVYESRRRPKKMAKHVVRSQASKQESEYIISVDSSEGTKVSDWQVGTVLDPLGEHVATIRVRIPLIQFAGYLIRMAYFYNQARIIIEDASNGRALFNYLKASLEPGWLASKGAPELLAKPYHKVEMFKANKRTKAIRVEAMVSALDRDIDIRDPDIVTEMVTLDPETGKAKEDTHTDDYLDALGIGQARFRMKAFAPKTESKPTYATKKRRSNVVRAG